MADFAAFVEKLFRPGGIYTFVGAGGKSTALRTVAAHLARRGIRVRMTTTTRIAVAEFSSFPVSAAGSAEEAAQAFTDGETVRLVVADALPTQGKYAGLDVSFFKGLSLDARTVLLVEGDGSRKRPLKVPTSREPVIPVESDLVLAVLGASGFDEPIDEAHCYNHEAAFAILGSGERTFNAASIAALAAHPAGCRKGVLPRMGFHVLLNQGDLEDKRETGRKALQGLASAHGISGSLVSLQQEVLYETTVH
ncbi:MAG: selenium cofactor biosynthesis protein YqeC [Spirochaetia bacterium]